MSDRLLAACWTETAPDFFWDGEELHWKTCAALMQEVTFGGSDEDDSEQNGADSHAEEGGGSEEGGGAQGRGGGRTACAGSGAARL